MPGVRTAPGNEGDLGPRAGTFIGVAVGGGHAEFLNRVLSDGKNGSKSVTAVLVVDVDAVESDIALIAARAIHGAVARVLIFVCGERGTEGISCKNYASLQAEKFRDIAAIQWEILHLRLGESSPQGRVSHVQGGASDVTETVSVVAPIFSSMLTVDGVFTNTCRPVFSWRAKPAAATDNW